MGQKTLISWCDATWNPWLGCDKVSPGCKNCYIVNTAPLRIRGMKHGDPRKEQSENIWKLPFRLNKKPWICNECGKAYTKEHVEGCENAGNELIWCGECNDYNTFHRARAFTLSLGDWLDPKVPIEWLARMLDTMRQCPDVDFLTVTKRPELWQDRLFEIHRNYLRSDLRDWCGEWLGGNSPRNIWIIGSAENQEMADKRIPELLKIPAVVHGISAEPLLGPIDLGLDHYQPLDRIGKNNTLHQINWVICGGESGTGARPCNVEWIRSLVKQCAVADVACFVKQLGKRVIWRDNPTEVIGGKLDGLVVPNYELRSLKHKKGGDINEWPADLQVHQWPKGRA